VPVEGGEEGGVEGPDQEHGGGRQVHDQEMTLGWI
jgi:hypothetical protein